MREDVTEFTPRDRRIAIGFLAAVAALTLMDIIEDLLEGATALHAATEGLVVAACMIGVVVLWRRSFHGMRQRTRTLEAELVRAHSDLSSWQHQTETLRKGLHEAIAKQLVDWQLTAAEQDVAFMLLKGLSIKEIASARETSERTVRQQSAAIYQKSKLEGRAQLAAFFLEDVL